MNRCDDYTGPLFATYLKEGVRSRAYGRLMRDSVWAKEQAKGAAVFMDNPG